MKQVTTTVKTGDLIKTNSHNGIIGAYKQGKIEVKLYVGAFGCITQWYSTRKLNQLIKEGKIEVI